MVKLKHSYLIFTFVFIFNFSDADAQVQDTVFVKYFKDKQNNAVKYTQYCNNPYLMPRVHIGLHLSGYLLGTPTKWGDNAAGFVGVTGGVNFSKRLSMDGKIQLMLTDEPVHNNNSLHVRNFGKYVLHADANVYYLLGTKWKRKEKKSVLDSKVTGLNQTTTYEGMIPIKLALNNGVSAGFNRINYFDEQWLETIGKYRYTTGDIRFISAKAGIFHQRTYGIKHRLDKGDMRESTVRSRWYAQVTYALVSDYSKIEFDESSSVDAKDRDMGDKNKISGSKLKPLGFIVGYSSSEYFDVRNKLFQGFTFEAGMWPTAKLEPNRLTQKFYLMIQLSFGLRTKIVRI